MTLLYAALAYLLGLALARWWWEAAAIPCPLGGELWLIALACLPLVPLLNRFRRRRPQPPLRWPEEAGFEPPGQPPAPALLAGVALCLAAGFLRYGSQPFTPCWQAGDLAYYNLPAEAAFDRGAQQVTVTGVVDSYPLVVDGEQELYVAAQTIAHGGRRTEVTVQGTVRVTTSGTEHACATASTSPSRVAWSSPQSLRIFRTRTTWPSRGCGSVMYGAAVKVLDAGEYGNPLLRRTLCAACTVARPLSTAAWPSRTRRWPTGCCWGSRRTSPTSFYDQFKATGTSHVIVISGTNVALIAGVIIAVAARLMGRRRAAWPALAAIAGYALLVGGDATVVRAAVMGGLFVTAVALRRRSTALVSLAAACMAMTLANPLALWDVGLQLSAMATAGLVRARRRGTRCAGRHAVRYAGASVATLPLGLYYFGRLSPASLPANLLIAPAQPLILFGGSAALLAGAGEGRRCWAGCCCGCRGWGWRGRSGWCAGRRRCRLPTINVGGFGVAQVVVAYAVIGAVRWRREVWVGIGAVAR